jgi:uncharacterized protein (TIGR03437 family)
MAASDPANVRLPLSYGALQPPVKGANYTDPAFPSGSSIKRLTDALNTPNVDTGGNLPWIEDEYSTAAAFSNDNSHLILVHVSYFGLYDGSGTFVSSLPLEINASSEPRWSRTDNNTLYYHAGNQLKSYNVVTSTTQVVHTFSEYSSISGNGEMDVSQDGDHFVFGGDGRYVFVYTISTDSKSNVFDTLGNPFDSMYITPDNHVTITWDAAGVNTRFTGIEMFDVNMNFLRQVAHAGGHMHMSRDINGDEVLIWTNSNDSQPACGQNAIVKIHLADGVQTCLLSLDWSLAVHISAADNTWAFVETYNPVDIVPPNGWVAYTDELLQIKLDGSQILRLAQHRSRPTNGYVYMPKLTVSRDGSILIYSSNFGLAASDEYMMRLSSAAPAPPAPSGTAILNSASYQSAISPGEIISIFGSGLAGTVSFNNIPAPLFYVSPSQINAQVPYGLDPGTVTVQVSALTQTMTMGATAPGIFTTNQTGSGPGAILRADDYQTATPSTPAHPGGFIAIYCTGLGQLTSPVAAGTPAPNPSPQTVVLPQVLVGNTPATVTFSGLAPGFVGLYQVNAQLPIGVQTGGAVPLVLISGGVSSNPVTVAIQ